MRMARSALLPIALSACAVAPQSARPQPASGVAIQQLAGCYELRVGDAGGDQLYFAPPAMRLTNEPDDMLSQVFARTVLKLVRLDRAGVPISSPDPGFEPMLFWELRPDTIVAVISTGHSGSRFAFATPNVPPDTLRGQATEIWDVGPPFESAPRPARAVRRSCADEADSSGG
jgi:hypothetical protein